MADITSLSDDELKALNSSGAPASNGLSAMSDDQLRALHAAPDAGMPTVAESDFKPATADQLPKEYPGFLKSVEGILSGGAEGELKYTAMLLNQVSAIGKSADIAGGKSPQQDSLVTNAYKYWKQNNEDFSKKYSGGGVLTGAGELGGELLATAPAGPLMGAIGKTAKAVGDLTSELLSSAPGTIMGAAGLATKELGRGAKIAGKLAEYGTAGVGNTGVLAGLEGVKFDEKNPDASFNFGKAADTLTDPSMLALSMGGHLLGNKMEKWTDKAQLLEEAKQTMPDVRMREVVPNKLSSVVFDPGSNLLNGVSRIEGIGDKLATYVNNMSGKLAAQTSDEYKTIAARELQDTMQNLKQGADDMWNRPFKIAPVENTQEIKDLAIQAQDIIRGSTIPNAADHIKLITDAIQKDNFTVEDAKTLYSSIGNAAGDAFKEGTSIPVDKGSKLSGIKEQLIDSIKTNLAPDALKDFNAARTMSKNYFDTVAATPQLKDAMNNTLDAKNLIGNLLGNPEHIDKAKTFGMMTDKGKDATTAAYLTKALEEAGQYKPGAINLSTFANKIGPQSPISKLTDPDTNAAIQGLHNLLTNAVEASKRQIPDAIKTAGLLGIGGSLATGIGSAPLAIAGVTYAALAAAANYSPIKSALGKLGRNAAEGSYRKGLSDSVNNYLSTRVSDLMTRAGYFMNSDGDLDYKPVKKGNK